MAGGRPTEYDADKVGKAVGRYISDCKEKYYLPTVEGLAVELCVARSTLYAWSDPKSEFYHEEFSDILEQLKSVQASMLIQNGLKNDYNATITKLMLTKHGYVDKQEIAGPDGTNLFDGEAKEKGKAAIGTFLNRGDTGQGAA